MFMKKTLLVSALATIALAANAQQELVRPSGEFNFITKNLTVDGSIYPYSVENQNGRYVDDAENLKFTIYDKSFNTLRSFNVAMPTYEYEYDVTTYEAKAPVKRDIEYKDDMEQQPVDENGNSTTIKSMDEWKEYIAERYGKDKVIFTDAGGNFAFHENNEDWSLREDESYNYIRYRQNYWYYNTTTNSINHCWARVLYSFSSDNLNWEEIGTEKVKRSKTGRILETNLYDYDANCTKEYHPYLTQSLFNKDDKFEIVVKAYRKGTGDDGPNMSTSDNRPISVTEDYATYRMTKNNEEEVESYLSIINEDGKEIAALPTGSQDFDLYKIDGQLYLSVETYQDGQYQTIIYSVDNVNTGITELARTSPVAAKKYFNTQGQEVSKDTKGIVIQKGGRKYINK